MLENNFGLYVVNVIDGSSSKCGISNTHERNGIFFKILSFTILHDSTVQGYPMN